MDDRIAKALRALGLSQERIDELEQLVDSVKRSVTAQGLVTRQPAVTKPRRPAVRVTYVGPDGPRDYAGKAERTLRRIKAMKVRVSEPTLATDPPALIPPPHRDSAQWRKDQAATSQRFRNAGVDQALPATLRAIEKSRERGRKKAK